MKKIVLVALLAVSAATSGAAPPITIDPDRWFAYVYDPPQARHEVGYYILLSQAKCPAATRRPDWKEAVFYYNSPRPPAKACWNTWPKDKSLLNICQTYQDSSGKTLLGDTCKDASKEFFLDSRALPKSAF